MLHEKHLELWTTTEDIAKQLARVAEYSLAFLKCEMQLVCFLHLHPLANIASLRAAYVINSSSMKGQSASAVSDLAASAQQDTEVDILLSELLQHIQSVHEHIKPVLPSGLVVVIIFPLSSLIPRVLMRCIQSLIQPSPVLLNSLSSKSPRPDGSVGGAAVTLDGSYNSRYLRLVIKVQQTLTTLVESFNWEPAVSRMFSDMLIEETERLRKYLKLLESTSKELRGYIRENPDEYSSLEYKTLWDCVAVRSDEPGVMLFEDFWSTIR